MGFTLIEMMIVVAIIAILSSIAVPVFQQYVVRSRVSEALIAAADAKLNVLNVLASGGQGVGVQGYSHGYAFGGSSKNVSSVSIDPDSGQITVVTAAVAGGGTLTLMPYLGSSLPGVSLPTGTSDFLVPNQTVKWRCAVAGSEPLAAGQKAGSLPAIYAPAECR